MCDTVTRRERWVAIVATLCLAVFVAACKPTPPLEPRSYEDQIIAERHAKDEWFRADEQSPLLPGTQDTFLPLSYFPVDPIYRVPATLAAAPDQPVMEMPTSTGQRRQMRQAGYLEFRLKDQPVRLIALVEAEDRSMSRLSVMFADMTNGTETYAAGRYLDLDRSPSGIYEIDFNRAYHPYCYYNPTYDCPYPPQENRLKLPIRAGERIPKESS